MAAVGSLENCDRAIPEMSFKQSNFSKNGPIARCDITHGFELRSNQLPRASNGTNLWKSFGFSMQRIVMVYPNDQKKK
jgi:hypothetical protein